MLLTGSPTVDAFSQVAPASSTVTTALSATSDDSSDWFATGSKAVTSALVAATLWATPLTTPTNTPSFVDPATVSSVASAKEMASGTGSRVNKDADSLLRYGLPINNKEVCLFYCQVRSLPSNEIFSSHFLFSSDSLILLISTTMYRFASCRPLWRPSNTTFFPNAKLLPLMELR